MTIPRTRWLGTMPYDGIEARMKTFTAQRVADTADELWMLQHEPVFTQGIAGRSEHVLVPGDIPVIQTQRGGQVTYHGPGQVVAYPLIDLRRLRIYVKEFVFRLETAVLQVLQDASVTGHRVAGAPGIYVRLDDPCAHAGLRPDELNRFEGLGKIAALGVKVSNHCTYHGLAFNVDMDLEPFSRIDPCGYVGLRSIDLKSVGVLWTWQEAAERLAERLRAQLGSAVAR